MTAASVDHQSADYQVTRVGLSSSELIDRPLAIEVPIALEINGIGYAVMMATPADLHDYAVGFCLSERLVESAGDVLGIEPVELPTGWLLRISISQRLASKVIERARQRVTESSCGLCGLENLEQVMRPLEAISTAPRVTVGAIFEALRNVRGHQAMNAATGAAHAAAFCATDGKVVLLREDVGRHNALDKLVGALASGQIGTDSGFFLLTARCSYELVEKTLIAQCPLLVTISAPTSLAVDRARAHGLTLIALARPDTMLVASDPFGRFTNAETISQASSHGSA